MFKWLQRKFKNRSNKELPEAGQAPWLLEYRSNLLKILRSGNVPTGIDFSINGNLPFKFIKSEHLLWVFPSVEYLEQKTRREIVGRSTGTSIRVVQGVYFRVGRSKGRPVEYDEVVSRGLGLLAVTTKHIYFHGDSRSFRISFNKIVSVECLSDGVGITRDRASGHPEFFIVGAEEVDFAYDLIQAVPSVTTSSKTEVVPVESYTLLSDNPSETFEE